MQGTIIDPSLKLWHNFSFNISPRKLLTAWKKTGRQQEDIRLEEDLRTKKSDLAGKTKILDTLNPEKRLGGHWVGMKKIAIGWVWKKKNCHINQGHSLNS